MAEMEKKPSPLLMVRRTSPLLSLVKMMVAPGTTAPLESATVPVRVPVVFCPNMARGRPPMSISKSVTAGSPNRVSRPWMEASDRCRRREPDRGIRAYLFVPYKVRTLQVPPCLRDGSLIYSDSQHEQHRFDGCTDRRGKVRAEPHTRLATVCAISANG